MAFRQTGQTRMNTNGAADDASQNGPVELIVPAKGSDVEAADLKGAATLLAECGPMGDDVRQQAEAAHGRYFRAYQEDLVWQYRSALLASERAKAGGNTGPTTDDRVAAIAPPSFDPANETPDEFLARVQAYAKQVKEIVKDDDSPDPVKLAERAESARLRIIDRNRFSKPLAEELIRQIQREVKDYLAG